MHKPAILYLLSCLFLLPQQVLAAPVKKPVLSKHIKWTGTSWFGSAIVHDLGTTSRKIIGRFYDIIVWDGAGNELACADRPDGIYAP